MRRLASFVGIDWADSLLAPTVGGVPATSNSAWSERKVTGAIEDQRLDLWREELDYRSAERLAGAVGGVGRRFGYPLPRIRRAATLAEIASRRARLAVGLRGRELQERVQKKIFSSPASP